MGHRSEGAQQGAADRGRSALHALGFGRRCLRAAFAPGTDIAFLGGVINYLLTNDKIQREYVTSYTDASFIVKEEFAFTNGIFSGYDAEKRSYDKSSWDYETRRRTVTCRRDPTLAHPRCVYNLMKQHYSRYTPEMVERVCGTPKEKFLQICEMIGSTATPTRAMTIMYALGWTQHSVGSQMIRCGSDGATAARATSAYPAAA